MDTNAAIFRAFWLLESHALGSTTLGVFDDRATLIAARSVLASVAIAHVILEVDILILRGGDLVFLDGKRTVLAGDLRA